MNILKILLPLVFALCTGSALAEDIRVLQSASGQNWTAFKQFLDDGKYVNDNVFPTVVLGQVAFEFARERGYLMSIDETMRTREAFPDLFKKRNGLGDTITVDEFRSKGQGAGFFLPGTVKAEAPAPTVAQGSSAVPAKVLPPKTEEKPAPAKNAEDDGTKVALGNQAFAIATIERELEAVRKELASGKSISDALKALDGRVGNIAKQQMTMGENFDEFRTAFQALKKNSAAEVAKQKTSVDTKLITFDGRLTTVEGDVKTLSATVGWGQKVVIGLSVSTLLIVILVYALWRRMKMHKWRESNAGVESPSRHTAPLKSRNI